MNKHAHFPRHSCIHEFQPSCIGCGAPLCLRRSKWPLVSTNSRTRAFAPHGRSRSMGRPVSILLDFRLRRRFFPFFFSPEIFLFILTSSVLCPCWECDAKRVNSFQTRRTLHKRLPTCRFTRKQRQVIFAVRQQYCTVPGTYYSTLRIPLSSLLRQAGHSPKRLNSTA